MIRDAVTKSEIVRDWAVLRKLSSAVHRSWMSGGGDFINETRPEDSYNLPFLLAYAVLDQVLSELTAQGDFSCKSWKLGEKMAASRSRLPWQDYDTVQAGKEARNKLAHEAALVAKVDCLRFIDTVERELKFWAVI